MLSFDNKCTINGEKGGVGVLNPSTIDSVKVVCAHSHMYLMTRMSEDPVSQYTKEGVGDGLTVT